MSGIGSKFYNACGGLNVQRPTLNFQRSTLMREINPSWMLGVERWTLNVQPRAAAFVFEKTA